jgi:hypothetical protein
MDELLLLLPLIGSVGQTQVLIVARSDVLMWIG